MKSIALDTNAYRALLEGNATVAERVRSAVTVGLPVIVLGELYFGFENGSRTAENLERLDAFLATPRLEILHITADTARLFGEIATVLEKTGKRIQQDDVWIAALCKQYGFSLVTADKGFTAISGLNVLSF